MSATDPQPDTVAMLDFMATCPWGVESLLVEELTALGASVTQTSSARVMGRADLATLYRLCLWSRLANRIIRLLGRVEGVADGVAITRASAGFDWPEEMDETVTLRVDFHGTSERIRHTRFGAQCVKDGVVEAMRAAGRGRPLVEPKTADVSIHAHFHRDTLTLGIDLSGDSLHLRGYRREGGQAPLKENLAAALLMRADWPERAARGEALLDPMCGSGTLVIEAAMMACDIAPNLNRRRFGFHGWAQHDEALWQEIHRQAEARAEQGRQDCQSVLQGRDRDKRTIRSARSNAERAGLADQVSFIVAEAETLTQPHGMRDLPGGLIMTNPPYGERLGELPALVVLYQKLGSALRHHFPGWSVALFTGNPELGHRLGLKAHRQYALKNGQLDCKLLLIDIHARSDEPENSEEERGAQKQESASPPVVEAPARHSAGAQMFANRLRKNRKRLAKWLRRSGEQCYRLYDADMPEYALAIDCYADRVHVQEYVPPRSIDPQQAEKRLMEALGVLPEVLEVDPEAIHLKRRQRQSGRSQYGRQAESGQRLEVVESPIRALVNLRDYLDTGLFLDHRPVRRWLGTHAKGQRFLNLFCYTATATVHAALGGARSSVSVDLSNTYLDWARENFRLNHLDERRHQLVRADCLQWLAQARDSFDLIFLDPPTFSNSKKMEEVLDVQRDHVRLIELSMALLAPEGTLLFSNNQRRFRLDGALRERFHVEERSKAMLDPDFERRPDIHHVFLIRHRKES
ncbi:bifunctional 23S rRNA (guanine(2069)-N(7))-methyltransferase RlmK/23S rRNA (guanine(2445)-N(2))-methyltransferase RlmL [Kushneria phosphatilytica]|uniref:Ribosomal RNA large subunit methyltransferase K/L n=1 Tax=Kushneria phosphatilytica TaxID=657387 RepID=A0A1S1NU92_9GAMM|nr:bifunctional 23S rRNA (guanine(2069)-N(7))-methyltransferase RlmK/23S rRNA (guanine(2445)-N(2))-methyltransferase RlmL [Kushneria phosphatilytica]OHV09921.1 23S rRNA (guanine(2445)-N(2))/(guanine(2069)-N(7))-methyltransferase [Kushneria phosphatilytica]QEL11587.1 bifunctional 23S rRNA (guanine(2069)-N(7))-methyltransferase RlmK/23S rRNA (guanine(2445)-N(2))-methyltransferase RlmL [Kushneria phosphatilytica]